MSGPEWKVEHRTVGIPRDEDEYQLAASSMRAALDDIAAWCEEDGYTEADWQALCDQAWKAAA